VRRSDIASLVITVALTAAAVFGALLAGWGPVLGLDLRGGVAVVLEPTEPTDTDSLDQAIEIIRNRVDAIGVAEPDITRQDQNIVVQLPGVDDAQRALELVGQTAELRFRPVIATFNSNDAQQRFQAQTFLEALNASQASTTTVPATATTEATAAETTEPETTEPETTEPETSTPDSTTAPPTTTPDTTTPDTTTPDTTTPDTTTPDESAETTAADSTTTTVPVTTTTFDVSTAPDLEELLTQPDMEDPDAVVALASLDGTQFFLLGATEATGEIISTASASFNGQWIVPVDFTSSGSDTFNELAARNFGQQVAITVDGVVYSAPTIQAAEFDGAATISGQFTEEEAKDLALVLRFGALPVELEPQTVQSISATLGQDALEAGIIAGLVGLLLVAIYMIAMYRLLGVVAMLSLVVSGAMLWFIIAWLGEWQGLALTLAGATGIVLSIGVAVDSNIVYYESIKEQVRRGRAVRSAADASFPGAFSTIVKADLASIIGAAILYTLTVGAVKGFALYLGIATLLDLLVSYVFMRPLVVLVTRKFAADAPSRLGVVREEVAS